MRRSCFVSSGKKDRADTLFLSSLSSINHAQEFSFLIYFPSVQQTRLARRLSVSSSVCLSFSFLCSVCLSQHRESVFSLRWCDKHLNSTPKTDKKAKNWSKASRSAWQKKKKNPKKQAAITNAPCTLTRRDVCPMNIQTARALIKHWHFRSLSLSFTPYHFYGVYLTRFSRR